MNETLKYLFHRTNKVFGDVQSSHEQDVQFAYGYLLLVIFFLKKKFTKNLPTLIVFKSLMPNDMVVFLMIQTR